jgi:predicted nuclease of restriction endonuclease-like (RecB) superfamily
MGKLAVRSEFAALLADVKGRIQVAQTRAVLTVNSELVRLYWDVGRIINARQRREGWGAGVIPRLARALKKESPKLKGFSERNIGRMIAFYRQYSRPTEFLPLAVAKLRSQQGLQSATTSSDHASLWSIPWAHHLILMDRVKELGARRWYMQQTLANGWSRDSLVIQIESSAHARHGKVVSNFSLRLPAPQSDLAQQALKDPYIFDFLALAEPFQERELEAELVGHVQSFLLELGQGFAFVGRQYRLDIGEHDFYVDLLFYHLRLRAFVVIDLKKGSFKPEYAGKLNFYCSVVNDRLKHPDDSPTIGLILCQTRDQMLAEYSFAGIDKPIGVSTYVLTRALPTQLRSALPTVEEIEAGLSGDLKMSPKTRGREQ